MPSASATSRASSIDAGSRSNPSTRTPGYPFAIATLDQPVPHATSATRADPERSRSSTSGIAGSHSLASRLTNCVRFMSPCPSTKSGGKSAYGTPLPVRNASSTCGKRLHHPDHHPREGRHVVDAVAVEQDLVVSGRNPVPALVRGGRGVLDLEDAAHRLVLQPLADVALVAARGRRDLGRSRRAAGERGVEPEPVAEVDGMEVVEPEDGLEEPLDERVAPLGLRARGHGATLALQRGLDDLGVPRSTCLDRPRLPCALAGAGGALAHLLGLL